MLDSGMCFLFTPTLIFLTCAEQLRVNQISRAPENRACPRHYKARDGDDGMVRGKGLMVAGGWQGGMVGEGEINE